MATSKSEQNLSDLSESGNLTEETCHHVSECEMW